jgi:fructose-bisphosphate aldolase class 1
MEPKVLIKSPTRAEAEAILRDELPKGLDALGGDDKVVIKQTIPEVASPLQADDRPPERSGSSPCPAATSSMRPACGCCATTA